MVLIFGHSANVQLIRETSISISRCGRIQTAASSLSSVDPSYEPKWLKLRRRFGSTQCNAPHGWPQLGSPLARSTGTPARASLTDKTPAACGLRSGDGNPTRLGSLERLFPSDTTIGWLSHTKKVRMK